MTLHKAHINTDKRIGALKRRIDALYGDTTKRLQIEFAEFLSQYEEADKKAKSEMEPKDYIKWRTKTICMSKEYKDFMSYMAEEFAKTRVIAQGIINESLVNTFVDNFNAMGEDIGVQIENGRK